MTYENSDDPTFVLLSRNEANRDFLSRRERWLEGVLGALHLRRSLDVGCYTCFLSPTQQITRTHYPLLQYYALSHFVVCMTSRLTFSET
jgi:hypothetical protein